MKRSRLHVPEIPSLRECFINWPRRRTCFCKKCRVSPRRVIDVDIKSALTHPPELQPGIEGELYWGVFASRVTVALFPFTLSHFDYPSASLQKCASESPCLGRVRDQYPLCRNALLLCVGDHREMRKEGLHVEGKKIPVVVGSTTISYADVIHLRDSSGNRQRRDLRFLPGALRQGRGSVTCRKSVTRTSQLHYFLTGASNAEVL